MASQIYLFNYKWLCMHAVLIPVPDEAETVVVQ